MGGFNDNWAGPIAALGGNIAGGLFQNIGARRREKRADKRNVKNWNMQNKYNSPVEQMKRFKEAGLNPNLMYGQGSAGNAQPITPASEQERADFGNVGSETLGAYNDTKQRAIGNKILEEQLNGIEIANKIKDSERIIAELNAIDRAKPDASIDYTDNEGVHQVKKVVYNKYSAEALKNYLDSEAKKLANENARIDLQIRRAPDMIKNQIKSLEEKYKQAGLQNEFQIHRNRLASDGLTFSTNDWIALISELKNLYEQYKNRK